MARKSKREQLREMQPPEFHPGRDDEEAWDRERNELENYKDHLFSEWLDSGTRTLGRIPEYRWLFSDMTPDWFTAEQVAERMGVSKKTVYGWCKKIIGARPGEGKTGYRIPRSGLVMFLADTEEEDLEEEDAEPGRPGPVPGWHAGLVAMRPHEDDETAGEE
jgi:excisionase family DNA binding protein